MFYCHLGRFEQMEIVSTFREWDGRGMTFSVFCDRLCRVSVYDCGILKQSWEIRMLWRELSLEWYENGSGTVDLLPKGSGVECLAWKRKGLKDGVVSRVSKCHMTLVGVGP